MLFGGISDLQTASPIRMTLGNQKICRVHSGRAKDVAERV
jgi:hypothetical protein